MGLFKKHIADVESYLGSYQKCLYNAKLNKILSTPHCTSCIPVVTLVLCELLDDVFMNAGIEPLPTAISQHDH